MFYVLAFLGWAVFDAYSGFTLFVLWMCHSLCTPDVPRKNKSDSPNVRVERTQKAETGKTA
jgi:hypothetical protein